MDDRYLGFSAELLRLALAGLAAVGFLIATLSKDGVIRSDLRRPEFAWFVIAAMAMLGASVGAALAHRFLASDGMYYHLRAIKHLIVTESPRPQGLDDSAGTEAVRTAESDDAVRYSLFRKSGIWLFASATLLISGVGSLGISMTTLLLP